MPLRSFAVVVVLIGLAAVPLFSQCAIVGEFHSMGPGCGSPDDGVITIYPALNSAVLTIASGHPHAMGVLYASLGPVTPFQYLGCTVYVDPAHLILALPFMTDLSGNFSVEGSLPNDPSLSGLQIIVQATIWLMGPEQGDSASSAASLTFQCMSAGGQGCTPGFWKQTQHFGSWPAQYSPNQLFSSVFADAFPGMTLLEVLETGGGGLEALGRHTVAALLDSATLGAQYGLSPTNVINMFNGVFGASSLYEMVKNFFAGLNEQGCPN